MSEDNAKREARRRKILQNTENRLNKIINRGKETNPVTEFHSHVENDPKHIPTHNQILDVPINNVQEETNVNGSFDRLPFNTTKEEHPTVHPNEIPYNLIQTRLIYVLLALVVNILLMFELDHLYGSSIIVPCCPMLITRLISQQTKNLPGERNIIFTALILSNMKPNLITKVEKVTFIFNTLIMDITLYIFSFTLMYWSLNNIFITS